MEEYKYVLIQDASGDTTQCRALVDSLDALGRKYLASAEFDGEVLHLTWNKWIPPTWKRAKVALLQNGKSVQLENRVENDAKLPPSLLEALRFLMKLKGGYQPAAGEVPEQFADKIERLDQAGVIDGDFEIAFKNLEFKDGSPTVYFYKHLKDFAVTDLGKTFL